MTEDLKRRMKDYMKDKFNFDCKTDEDITGFFQYNPCSFEDVFKGEMDRHRWYSLIPTVVKMGDFFVLYDYCDVYGENADIEDCIGGYDLDDFVEVFPIEVKAIKYVTEEPTT